MDNQEDTCQITESSLYPRLIGPCWLHLADSVRKFLYTAEESRWLGGVRIWQSGSPMVGLLARLLGLPKPGESVPAELLIVPERGGEIWRRKLGDRTLTTMQRGGLGGMLMEHYGPFEFAFALHAKNGTLHFEQVGVRIHLGRFRPVVPGWLSPRVSAVCGDAGADRTFACVQISAPLIGVLLAYEGEFARGE